MPQHVLSASSCSFALADLDPIKYVVPLVHPSPQRYGITGHTWRIVSLYRAATALCLHIYAITLYLVPKRYIVRRHYISPYRPVISTQLYRNVYWLHG